jgi:hypothetical protein
MGTSVTPVLQAFRGTLNTLPFGIASVTGFGAVNDGIVDWSIWKDLGMLLKTIPAVLFIRGAS